MDDLEPFVFTFGNQVKRGNRTGHHNRIPHVTVNGVEKKSCAQCGSLKPLDKFNRKHNSWDALQSSCRDCQSELQRKRGK